MMSLRSLLKQEMKSNITKYLDFVYTSQKELVETGKCLPHTSNKRYCDIPPHMSFSKLEKFVRDVKTIGYSGVHSGLTSIWSKPNEKYITILKKVGFGAAHGTSVKWQLCTGNLYETAVKNDRQVIDRLDPTETVCLNYDLFAGNLAQELSVDRNVSSVKNADLLVAALGLKDNELSISQIMLYIIKTVRKVYKNSQRPIVFEVPGTLGVSMFPSPKHFIEIRNLLKKVYPEARICIDVGHLLTWMHSGMSLKSLSESLDLLKGTIGMIHISSAGSHNHNFKCAYVKEHGKHIPDWHIYGLDLMLALHEKEMLLLIEKVRLQQKNSTLVEVCETRNPTTAINDYFKTIPMSDIDDTPYFMSLKLQAKLLGYI